jgi:hypothetical protein
MRRTSKRQVSRPVPAATRRHFRPRLEALEARYAPSCTWNSVSGTVIGNDDAYNIVNFQLSGSTTTIKCNFGFLVTTSLTYLAYNAGSQGGHLIVDDSARSGGDSYFISGSALEIPSFGYHVGWNDQVAFGFLYTGAGNDAITWGNAGGLGFDFTINGGGGANLLVADASSVPGGDTYQVSQFDFHNSAKSLLQYSAVDDFLLKTGPGNDSVTIASTTGTLFNTTRVTVDGGAGFDTVTLDDSGYSGGDHYAISEVGVSTQRLGAVAFYEGVEKVALKSGGGNDVATVADSSNALNGLPLVSYSGGAGKDRMEFIDLASTADASYWLTESGLNRSAHGDVGYYDSSVELATLDTGMGNNSVTLSNTQGKLDGMPAVFIYGGLATDTINVKDYKNPSAAAYYVATSGTIGYGAVTAPAAGFTVGFEGIETVNLYRSLKPGTIVDTSGYDPAFFDLNVIVAQYRALGGKSRNAPPAPPISGNGITQAAADAGGASGLGDAIGAGAPPARILGRPKAAGGGTLDPLGRDPLSLDSIL